MVNIIFAILPYFISLKDSKGDTVMRALTSHQCGPGLKVLCSGGQNTSGVGQVYWRFCTLLPEVFLWIARFLLSSKTNNSKLNLIRNYRKRTMLWMCCHLIVTHYSINTTYFLYQPQRMLWALSTLALQQGRQSHIEALPIHHLRKFHFRSFFP